MWSWEHISVGRPIIRPGYVVQPFGGPEHDIRHAYGMKWSGPKRYIDRVKGTLSTFRKDLDQMRDDEILWEAYQDFVGPDLDLAPPTILAEEHLWYARIPMIHFWAVEFHYPDRVMRQLGHQQTPTPPPPEPWEEHEALMLYEHSKDSHNQNPDWPSIHAVHIQEWGRIEERSVDPQQPWDPSCIDAYQHWYVDNGKCSINVRNRILRGLNSEMPGPSQDMLPTMAPPPRHPLMQRLVHPLLC